MKKTILLILSLVALLVSHGQGIKISALPTHTGSAATAYVPIVVSGQTRKATGNQLAADKIDSLKLSGDSTYFKKNGTWFAWAPNYTFFSQAGVDYINRYTVDFGPNSFTDGTLTDYSNAGTVWFNRGLRINTSQAGNVDDYFIRFESYGMIAVEKFVQRLTFRVLDSTTTFSVGLGVKSAGIRDTVAGTFRDNISYISGTVGNPAATLTNEQQSASPVSTAGVLVNVGDFIEMTLTHNLDSNVVTFRNLNTNTVVKVVKTINSASSSAGMRMGYPAIYAKAGQFQFIDWTILKPAAEFDYIFIGNSTTFMNSASSQELAWVNRLQRYTGSRINNYSRPSACVYDFLRVIEDLNFRNKTVFMSGVWSVDPVANRTTEQIKADYQELVTRIKANGNRVVHLYAPYREAFFGAGGMAQIDTLNAWVDSFYTIAGDSVFTNNIGPSDLAGDLIHPDDSGQDSLFIQTVTQGAPFFEKWHAEYSPLKTTDGYLGAANTGFTWNKASKYLGINTGEPISPLHLSTLSTGITSDTSSGIRLSNAESATASANTKSPSLYQGASAWQTGSGGLPNRVGWELYAIGVNGSSAGTTRYNFDAHFPVFSGKKRSTAFQIVYTGYTINRAFTTIAGQQFTDSAGTVIGSVDLSSSLLFMGYNNNMANGYHRFSVQSVNIGYFNTSGLVTEPGKVGSFGLTTPNASAILSATSTTQGFLPPRMTAAQAGAIASPAEGLLVYVTDTDATFTTKGWWGWNGSAWEKLNN